MGIILPCETDAAWLALKAQHVTSTDVPDIAGLGYRTVQELYHRKAGTLKVQDNKYMRWGRRLQDDVAEEYELVTGCKLSEPPRFMRHETHEWAGSSFDYFANNGKTWMPTHTEAVDVEIKTAGTQGNGWGQPGTDEVPEGIVIQCQWQMAVANLRRCDVAALFMDTRDFAIYPLTRDDGLVESLFDLAHAFWQKVLARTPPEPDWNHADTPSLIRRLYGVDKAESVELGADEDALLDSILDLRISKGEADVQAELLEAQLLEKIGQAHLGLLPSGRKITRKKVTRKAYAVAETSWIGTNLGQLLKERKKQNEPTM